MTSKTEATTALHARLDLALSEMEKQKYVLEKLERSVSSIRRQLNDVHDPMARLPCEISSEIFIHCLPPVDNVYPRLSDPLLLLSICTRWTEIAVSTSQLWANLIAQIPSAVTAEFAKLLDGWLQRAGGSPLSLSFDGCTVADPKIVDVLAAHSHHIRDLVLRSPSYLKLFSPGTTFPCLDVVLVKRGHPSDLASMTVNEILQVLRCAPNLTECTIDLSYVRHQTSALGDVVHHIHLTALTIEGFDCSHILRVLTLPSLEDLEVPIASGKAGELISFLTRSSPPLDTLSIDVGDIKWAWSTVKDCFSLIPALAYLELTGEEQLQDTLIALLARTPRDVFLPNLTSLTIARGSWAYPDTPWYKSLSAMLSGRREQFTSFCLKRDQDMWQYSNGEPDEDDTQVLRELTADGMEIDLGPGLHHRIHVSANDSEAPSEEE
ncbi:hypothetical protein C8R44DRAFT_892288 [Mycena epipterygia]|nr:hypothetical protein C8R44DRAFT_892288 [Mycena epipterygia]